jgi:insertion element IS1 protein InsB
VDYIERNKEEIPGIILVRVEEAEMDEMWSFVHDKSQQYWLWWAIDHKTGEPLAYTFGTREHANLDELRSQLNVFFDIKAVYTDGNAAYLNINESEVIIGKENTQRIENKHISLRTWCSRLVRKGIRFSKLHLMHRVVIGLVINFWFFNCKLW